MSEPWQSGDPPRDEIVEVLYELKIIRVKRMRSGWICEKHNATWPKHYFTHWRMRPIEERFIERAGL